MFCKGDEEAVTLLLRAFATFSKSSGLQANTSKSTIYLARVNHATTSKLLKISCFSLGSLPFKYLGIPVFSKRLGILDCEFLVNKITARIKTWGTRNLSYAGRVQLVNSVLLSMHSYWASIFILPKTVIKKINAISRQFLWEGKHCGTKVPPVAWDFLCRPKRAGGLGLHDLIIWNIASMGKYVWNIATKDDCLWVRWIDHVYLKNSTWWEYSPSLSACWYWKAICGITDKLSSGYQGNLWTPNPKGLYSVSNGYKWLQAKVSPLMSLGVGGSGIG